MQKTHTDRRSRHGLTLVEVMVSMMLMLMVFTGSYKLITSSARLSKLSRDHYVAVNLAKNRLERARDFQCSDLGYLAEDNLVVDANGAPDPKGQYARTTTVQPDYEPNLTKMTVTVKVRDHQTGQFSSGTRNQESMSTMFTIYQVK